nr:MAG TPA: hypothetical protein [Caudoviricetes sp.]
MGADRSQLPVPVRYTVAYRRRYVMVGILFFIVRNNA